ncbi:hypothetical protein L6164_009301 [Bauhinia variegata]|uniref:Uncharacterized protein n=1 Tax=Bauhinia variegata TaxID=167791 RepID=A0ACB9PJN8_BAUVA|nr:hypothetical protein L6164_009301 [Bauhinia variegata]
MLYFLISFLSIVIFSKSFTSNSVPAGESGTKPVSTGFWPFWGKFSSFLFSRIIRKSSIASDFFQLPLTMAFKKRNLISKVENEEEEGKVSLLDLPDLTLECILEHLSPAELCNTAAVCTYLRNKCRSDYVWEKHMKRKWGKVIGDSAYRQWRWHIASRESDKTFNQGNHKGIYSSLHNFWLFLWIKSRSQNSGRSKSSPPEDSLMALYLSLESGKFLFPAQVYNRENGHAGFMLSCYDAQICYDSRTDTFQARYSPHGRWAIEEDIQWDRLRVPPIDISPQLLHTSDCLDDLRPGDHIEIQWRRNKEFPYGWWYGVVGHLESCQANVNHCHCRCSDTVILEFKQYTSGSRWRQTVINRKLHREEGDEIDGFYGGIRKLHNEDEITRWKKLWPTKIVE